MHAYHRPAPGVQQAAVLTTMAANRDTRHGNRATNEAGRDGAAQPTSWLLRRKTAIPDPVTEHLRRPRLLDRATPTGQRVTVLRAPAGFGKTVLLAECCRRLGEDRVPVAWVSVDEDDALSMLDACIAFACRAAGLDIHGGPAAGAGGGGPWSGTERALHAVQALGGPFVLALDEPDRLRDSASLTLLRFLLHRGPPNLHVVMTCREIPVGLDLGNDLLDGGATEVGVEELRFSRSEVEEFFRLRPAHPETDRILAETAGWPFAVRMSRKTRRSTGPGSLRAVQGLIENWLEARLFERLEADERELVLDIGLFEWIEAALLDEVLGSIDSINRIDAIPHALDGLLAPVPGGAADRWQLPPLIRDHCRKLRSKTTPQRFSTIHRRIAEALMRRGETVPAVCHALEARAGALVGDIFEQAGGVRMPLREGTDKFLLAAQLLSEEVFPRRPRLELCRCLASVLSGRIAEARKRYAAVSATLSDLPGDASECDFELSVDDCIVRVDIDLYGAGQIGSDWVRAALPRLLRLARARTPLLDSPTRGSLWYRLCIMHGLTAQFDSALGQAFLARQYLADDRSTKVFVDLEMGQIAMAQGRVADAERHYGRAQREVRQSGGIDPTPVAIARILLRELALESSRVSIDTASFSVPRALVRAPMSMSAYAAASGTAIDLKFRKEGVDSALEATDAMLEYVLGVDLPALIRFLSAHRASLLATAGRVGDAEQDWRLRDLPEDLRGCLDLTGQSWREMEALSCARLRVLIAQERFDEGRRFAGDLCAVATTRGLRRTLMRALSLSIVLEHRAGRPTAGPLQEFLRLLSETPYAWPMVREREACESVVEAFLDSDPKSAHHPAAQSLLAEMRGSAESRYPVLSRRERQVLLHMEGQQDKEIAVTLGLTSHGVRYHMRQLFFKLGVHTRADAVRRAKELGLILGDF